MAKSKHTTREASAKAEVEAGSPAETQVDTRVAETSLDERPVEAAEGQTHGASPEPTKSGEELALEMLDALQRIEASASEELSSMRVRIEALEREVEVLRTGRPALEEIPNAEPITFGRLYPRQLRVRTRDPRRAEHHSGARRFGREWKVIETAKLSFSQLDAITTDPLLEVDGLED